MKFDNLLFIVIFLGIVSASGILAGLIYYDMAIIDSTLHTVNFQLPIQNNASVQNITDFQDVLTITVYPVLGLRSSLPYLTYFMVFAFIIALGMVSYITTKNPIFFVVHLLFSILMTYFCIIISNKYAELLSNPFLNSLMVNFTIYNKLMLYLPQIVFFTALVTGAISFVNIVKPASNDPSNVTGLNYGGDY